MIDIFLQKKSHNFIYYTFKSKTSKVLKDLKIIFYKNYCILSVEHYNKLLDTRANEDTVKINFGD